MSPSRGRALPWPSYSRRLRCRPSNPCSEIRRQMIDAADRRIRMMFYLARMPLLVGALLAAVSLPCVSATPAKRVPRDLKPYVTIASDVPGYRGFGMEWGRERETRRVTPWLRQRFLKGDPRGVRLRRWLEIGVSVQPTARMAQEAIESAKSGLARSVHVQWTPGTASGRKLPSDGAWSVIAFDGDRRVGHGQHGRYELHARSGRQIVTVNLSSHGTGSDKPLPDAEIHRVEKIAERILKQHAEILAAR